MTTEMSRRTADVMTGPESACPVPPVAGSVKPPVR